MPNQLGQFVGFCSLPQQASEEDRLSFIKEGIKEQLFDSYKEKAGYKSDDHSMYNPETYFLWGKYDLCVISKIDDFDFSSRFHRSGNIPGNHKVQNFDYKILNGYNLIDEKFNPNGLILPYIAISQLKLNSHFLIGNGEAFLRTVRGKIISIINKIQSKTSSIIEYTLFDSYSYHELVLIVKGNSFITICEIITLIRSTEFKDLDLDDNYHNELLDNSLFKNIADKVDEFSPIPTPTEIQNHILESSQTTFGYHSDIDNFKNPPQIQCKKETLSVFTKLSIKPGHIPEVLSHLKKYEQNFQFFIVPGKGDLLLRGDIKIDSVKDINFTFNIFSGEVNRHIIERYSMVGLEVNSFLQEATELNQYIDQKLGTNHLDIHNCLWKYMIKTERIEEMQKSMKKMMLPKVLTEKLIKLVTNYNQAIINPDMFASYLELYSFINYNIVEYIIKSSLVVGRTKNGMENNTKDVIDNLQLECNLIESSFQNRFYQSYWTSEVLEVNIDYTGGLQNLITLYDTCLKSINNIYRSKYPDTSFLCIKSEHAVMATEYAIQFSQLHLIQPLVFCSVVTHELTNFITVKWIEGIGLAQDIEETTRKTRKEIIRLVRSAGIDGGFNKYLTLEEKEAFPEFTLYKYQKELFQLFSHTDLPNLPELFNPESLGYFIKDYFNYVTFFKKDYDLFLKVYWAYFLQLGNVLQSNNTIDYASFVSFQFRMTLIKRFIEKNTSHFPEIPEYNQLLDNHFILYDSAINRLIDEMINILEVNNWFTEVKNIIDGHQLFSKFYSIKEKVSEKYEKTIINYFNSKGLNRDIIFSDLEFDVNINQLSDVEIGSIYLEVLHQFISISYRDIKILIRNSTNGEISYNQIIKKIFPDESNDQDERHGLHIDLLGGFKVFGVEERKRYFKLNEKLLRLMFHLSQRIKLKYASKLFETSTG